MKPRKPKLEAFVDQKRNPDGKNWQMIFTARDGRILEHVWEYDGFLADYQIMALEFTGIRQAQDRLGKLFHNGYLERTSRRGRAAHGAMLYWLTRQGAEHVADVKGMEWEDLGFTKRKLKGNMEHDILTNDFTMTVQMACEDTPDLSLHHWINESVFRASPDRVAYTSMVGEKANRNLIPDRFFLIEREGEKLFRSRLLLELDNATHPDKRFADHKVLPGIAYLRSEAYQRRFGFATSSDEKMREIMVGGRWLVVTTSDDRLAFLKEITERVASEDAAVFYFTTFDRVTSDSVLTEKIWFKGGSEEPVELFPPM